jgi:hypothetical protein
MRTVFKTLSIIGILSFLGGLMNGTLFFGGILIAALFGYLGWREQSK